MDQQQRIEPRQAIEATAPPQPSTTRPDIPLTTIYTPPSSCNSIVTYDGTTLWQNGISQIGDPACYPPRFTEIYGSWYTPGICPQSWKSVGQVSHSPGHSDAMCCPDNYFLSTTTNVPVLNNFCFSLMTTPLTRVYSMPSMAPGAPPSSPFLITLSMDQVSSTTVYADVIQIQWGSTDKGVIALMSSTAAPSTTTPKTSNLLSSPTSSPSSSSTSGSSPPGLSTDSKIGLGIAIPLAAILVAALTSLFFLRRKRSQEQNGDPRLTSPIQDHKLSSLNSTPHELHNDFLGQSAPAEMGADPAPLSELPTLGGGAGAITSELQGQGFRAELRERTPTEGKGGGWGMVRRKTPKEGVESSWR